MGGDNLRRNTGACIYFPSFACDAFNMATCRRINFNMVDAVRLVCETIFRRKFPRLLPGNGVVGCHGNATTWTGDPSADGNNKMKNDVMLNKSDHVRHVTTFHFLLKT